MRRPHFEALKPVCPRCLRDLGVQAPLELGTVLDARGDVVFEGILLCPTPTCRSEYPIVDGIPLIVADLRQFVTNNTLALLARRDLSDAIESLLGDCMGPGSAFDTQRLYLSTYAVDHYGDLDPAHGEGPSPGAIRRVADVALAAAGALPAGPVLDVGCSVGRTSFHLAGQTSELVLGVDLSVDMLRLAQDVLHHGRVRFPRRRVGLVYERREVEAVFPGAERVDFWAIDATALPFAPGTFGLVASLNVLDCVGSPYDHLAAVSRVLAPGGAGLLACPFDWSAGATQPQAWLGGHSQRAPNGGSSVEVLRSLLAGGGHGHALAELAIEREIDDVPWTVRLHDRAFMQYRSYLAILRKQAA
jgi:SAM-dependent methyltransferase/uncharacterized protein YbaR (Trm112 family)